MVSDIRSQSMMFLCMLRFLNLDAAGCKRILACYYKKIALRWLLPGEVAMQGLGYYAAKIKRSRRNAWMVLMRVRATHRSGWVLPQLHTEHVHHISLFQGEQWDCEAAAATLGAWGLPTIRTRGWNAYKHEYPASAVRVQLHDRVWRQLEHLRSSCALGWFWSTSGGYKLHVSL